MVFHKNDYGYRAVGASGAVTGVLYSAILLQPDMMLGIFFVIPMPAYIFGILYLLYSIYGMKAKNDNIGHTAHFGGAVGGYLITFTKRTYIVSRSYFNGDIISYSNSHSFCDGKNGKTIMAQLLKRN